MKKIEIEEVNNGYWVKYTEKDGSREYVFSSLDIFKMLEHIGKYINGKIVVVKEQ